MKKFSILVGIIIIFVIVVLFGGIFVYKTYYSGSKNYGPSRYDNPNVPSYLLKESELRSEYQMSAEASYSFVFYSQQDQNYICQDSGQASEKIVYSSFSAGKNVEGGWGSTAAYICGDYYIIVVSNDANPWTAYGLFKKDEGFQKNNNSSGVQSQIITQSTNEECADATCKDNQGRVYAHGESPIISSKDGKLSAYYKDNNGVCETHLIDNATDQDKIISQDIMQGDRLGWSKSCDQCFIEEFSPDNNYLVFNCCPACFINLIQIINIKTGGKLPSISTQGYSWLSDNVIGYEDFTNQKVTYQNCPELSQWMPAGESLDNAYKYAGIIANFSMDLSNSTIKDLGGYYCEFKQ